MCLLIVLIIQTLKFDGHVDCRVDLVVLTEASQYLTWGGGIKATLSIKLWFNEFQEKIKSCNHNKEKMKP